MALPQISIVTCSYQQGRFIDATIRSVLDQQYPNLEYLIIDGGSKDETVDVIRRHEDRLAYWVSEPDAGQTDALAKGFARSKGEIMGWLCSDDLLMPGALDTVGRYFAAHPDVDFVFGDAIWIDGLGHAIRPKKEMPWNRTVFLFDHNYFAQPSVFWRRRLFDAVGGLQVSWNLAMDSDLWLRFSNVAKPQYLPGYLSCVRYYPEQKTRAMQPVGRREDEALRQREAPRLARLPRPPMRLLACALRIGIKGLHGGYTAQVPAAMLPWLETMAIRPR